MTLLDRLRRLLWADSTNLTYPNRPESADLDKLGPIIPTDETTAILAAAERVPDVGRRRFLKLALAGVAVAATVDVDQLLWTPGKTFLLPGQPEFDEYVITDEVSSDDFTSDWFGREGLRILENKLTVTKMFNRKYDDQFDLKVGDTIRVRLPQKFNDHYDVRDQRVTVRLWS